ncbi:MAG: glutamyl-tRNA reductase [Leadbetterella sp.]
MTETFKVASISYKSAPLQLREKLVLDNSQVGSFMLKLKDTLNVEDVLVLSTCNRTEVYYRAENSYTKDIVKLLCVEKSISSLEVLPYFEEILSEDETIRYLFEVSLGLHSQIIGDQQIINQVKLAYQWSVDANMAGPFLHRVMHSIFYANKRVVHETSFRDGAASTSFVTLDLLESFANQLKHVKILVIGLGEVGADIAKTLFEREYQNVTLCNRTLAKTQEIASELNYDVLEFENLATRMADFNVIISSVRSDSPLISTKDQLRKGEITYIFDLSVPRSVSSAIEKLHHVVLYSLDEIQKRRDEGVRMREAAIPAVREIIDQLYNDLEAWSREQVVSPTIQKFKNALDQIRKEEMARYIKNLSQAEVDTIEKITNSIVQKVIKQPAIQLKAACKKGDPSSLIEVLNELFDLEKQGENSI